MMSKTVLDLIRATRLPAGPEKAVQAAIGDALTRAGIAHRREVRLSAADVIDFMVGGLGVEVKIKGARRAILRQLERYAAHEEVAALALVSSVAMGLPAAINGKPVDIVSMGRAWL